MTYYDQPAIQNSTGACFHCKGNLADVAPIDSWEVISGQTFIKVKCSNGQCGGIAWRLGPPSGGKRDVPEERKSLLKVTSYQDGHPPTVTRVGAR